MANMTIRMTRGAVLSGTITDENGAPASGVTVRALQLRVQNGERTFAAVASSGSTLETTDDRGMYRFFGLPPGDYSVTAQPRMTGGEIKAMTESEIRAVLQALAQQTAQTPGTGTPPPMQQRDADATTVAYAGVFYPGTTSATSAATFTIAPGEERRGIDFPLKLVRTARVEGTVVPPPGVAPQAVQLMMMPATTPGGLAVSGAAIELMAMNRVVPGPDGKFQFTGVAPGDYTISARVNGIPPGAPPPPPPPPPPPGAGGGGGGGQVVSFTRTVMATGGGGAEAMTLDYFGPAMGGGGPVFWGQADLTVDGNSISGVAISMQPGMTLTGKVQFKGTRLVPDGDLSRIRLTLSPAPSAGGAARLNFGGLPSATVEANGQFKFTGVTPGRYRVAGIAPVPMGSPPGISWTMQSAVAKGRDVLDFPLDVGPNDEIGEIVVTFGDALQEVNGALQDATGRPAPDYTIIVFAADNRFWTAPTRRVKSTRPGTDGKFTVSNLPPGEYRVAAVVDVSPTEITDPQFLEQLVAASVKITLAEGERKTQDLRISGGL
jgi:protocatechuate 3,4-dioxygenase beta subunit